MTRRRHVRLCGRAPFPMRALVLSLALLLVAAGGAGCAGSGRMGDTPPSRARALEQAVGGVAASHTGDAALWPGFDPLAVPLAVYDGERTVLFRHPAPPPEFVTDPEAPGASVFDGRHEAVTANSSAEIGGVPTATVLLDGSDRAPADLAPLAVHEAFHVFQRERHPSWAGNEADLFVYPDDDPDLLALRRLETEALRRALGHDALDRAACWTRSALALRAERTARLDSASVAYERGTELNEGLATYVENRAARRPLAALPPAEFGPADVRRRAYAVGLALAVLLDRFAPGWPLAFEADDRQTLDGALGRAVGPGAACAFGAAEIAGAGRHAEADVASLTAARAEREAAFEARPGWRVVVEAAAGTPLWPQGFDPINVERVGPGRVLHARFLRLGNAAGEIEALDGATADVEALTGGAGPHPLFNSVVRVEVAGLGEPEVSEAYGTVTVAAPGVRATFRGASVTRAGAVLTIRLSP